MFNLFKSKNKSPNDQSAMSVGLSKTRHTFKERLASLFSGKKLLDQNLLDELEIILLSSDVGISATQKIIEGVKKINKEHDLSSEPESIEVLKKAMLIHLESLNKEVVFPESNPGVVLVVGVNGVGKTTSVAKLASWLKSQDKSVMLAAGDTYRAAAIEQLQTWSDRLDLPLVAQQEGSDSAAVVYDGLASAKAKKMDYLIADTAGRLHTQDNLMQELEKVKRVIKKLDPDAPHLTLMVLDATTGQTALSQVKIFTEVLGIDGIILTKLDGTAKGGVIFSILDQLKIPVYFIGTGESDTDFMPFDNKNYINSLFEE